jgi:predicted Fe-S protein YdhL (DUF1289 family)
MARNDETDPILEQLPPEQLLETTHWDLIKAGIVCMHQIETVQQYVAYENQHQQRTAILRLLQQRAATIRERNLEENDNHSSTDGKNVTI